MRVAVLPPRAVEFHRGGPWDNLLEGLRSEGHDVDGFGIPQGHVDAIVSVNHQSTAVKLRRTRHVPPSRCALIALEPPATLPAMYRQRVIQDYGVRFAGSPRWATSLRAEPFLWPQNLERNEVDGRTPEFDATIMVGDKRSAAPDSLYGLRRQVIRQLDLSPLELAVFGPGWGDPTTARVASAVRATAKSVAAMKIPNLEEVARDLTFRPKNWLGTVPEKAVALAKAPVSIVIENSGDYVSEKLIDVIAAGVVPIYVGPPLAEFSLPPGIALACPPSADAILQQLLDLTKAESESILTRGRCWLDSKESVKHSMAHVLRDLGSRIGRAFAVIG